MFYYFSSDLPTAIKINGSFYGILSNEVKTLKTDLPAPFIELCPVSVSQPCVNLLLDEKFLCEPPPSVVVTDLKGGYLIKYSPAVLTQEFSVIEQFKSNDALVTVFNENGFKISVETRQDFYAETVDLNIKRAEIKQFSLGGAHFISVCMEDKSKFLAVYKIDGKIEKCFFRQLEEYCVDGQFSTLERFCDIAKHTVKCFWNYNGKNFERTSSEIKCDENFNLDALNERLIPYCFLEGRLAGEDCEKYLCGTVLENKRLLNGFLGDFVGIMPPPSFREVDEIGLIYRKRERLYSVEYFKFCLEGRKIKNLYKC